MSIEDQFIQFWCMVYMIYMYIMQENSLLMRVKIGKVIWVLGLFILLKILYGQDGIMIEYLIILVIKDSNRFLSGG